ncbi:large conductance mechanosensitive channel protein MscL [Alkalibacterium pelagium]|uniref:Large-conductance mechanosensitive channel n=1 Tax=Alkalibacterium pelagium TaxID=426702 RepID=A0A1H7ICI1_9LACT|nr:large conductance mechanosensitive channel protein MscL [Alkalibacterium pelagium]GEN50034.1 large-conductance mechanosensitive channel [Alkalibacterium pelagium]SEK60034.1 large conductance mechanosensitive channel [Alkalibacterium pelagium]
MIKEFRTFLMRGNVIELAVGIVMGAAFTAIVTALVEHVITPIIAAVTGNASIDQLTFQIGTAQIGYGEFLQAVIDFVLIALVLFVIIKVINNLSRKPEEAEEVEVEAPSVESYLEEIRDLLAERVDPPHSSRDDRPLE